jgi:hypothetical protein
MARARYDQASRPNVVVTQTPNGVEFLPLAGTLNADGSTASLQVDTGGGGGGGGGGSTPVASAIYTAQFNLTAGAAAVQITRVFPPSTLFYVLVQNIDGYPAFLGPAGVTASTGVLLTSGNSMTFALGPNAALYAYNSTGGSVVSVMELS